MTQDSDIFINELKAKRGKIGQIILNRPKALNALNLQMCFNISDALERWEKDADIQAVIIKSNGGRAFCAGGDIRALYDNPEYAHRHPHPFFAAEYKMNARLFHFSKPYISFLDGITMGGGAGISVHGSHRIATERLMFAMPETGIGFFPDIGASEFLLKCPGQIGWYLALTGNIISAHDAYEYGLATHVVTSDRLQDIETALLNTPIESHNDVSQIIMQFHEQPSLPDLSEDIDTINLCFSQKNVSSIVTLLREIGQEWSRNTANMLLSRSPTSVKVTFEQLKRASSLSFNDKIKMDFDIAQHFLEGHDFREGIRAALIDKDNRPHWQPASLDQVSDEQVEQYFQPLGARLEL